MRYFPRNAQSRADALIGPGHVANHGISDQKTMADRALRYKPALDLGTVRKEYGGTV
jgi:hypothetical protein